MSKRINQLMALSFEERRLLLVSIVLLPLTALALYIIGFKKTKVLMTKFIPLHAEHSKSGSVQLKIAERVARMVTIAANHSFYSANCLKKALVIWWLLKREGITTELKIGVKKEADNLQAHAWVELNGTPLTDPLTFLATKSFAEKAEGIISFEPN